MVFTCSSPKKKWTFNDPLYLLLLILLYKSVNYYPPRITWFKQEYGIRIVSINTHTYIVWPLLLHWPLFIHPILLNCFCCLIAKIRHIYYSFILPTLQYNGYCVYMVCIYACVPVKLTYLVCTSKTFRLFSFLFFIHMFYCFTKYDLLIKYILSFAYRCVHCVCAGTIC